MKILYVVTGAGYGELPSMCSVSSKLMLKMGIEWAW